MPEFDTVAATALYNVDRWGENYFRINDAGHVAVRPDRRVSTEIDLDRKSVV